MNIIYDFIIVVFLGAVGVFIAIYIIQLIRGRRWLLNRASAALFFALVFSWSVIFYGSFIEPRRIVISNQTIQLSKKPTETLRAALISDLHLGPYKKAEWTQKVVEKINGLKPDIILIAGDFVFSKTEQAKYLYPLKELKAPLGTFAILGNHDYRSGTYIFGSDGEKRATVVRKTLEEFGINVLVNKGKKLRVGKKTLYLLGTDEYWTLRADIWKSLKSINMQKVPHPSIVLAHNPDLIFYANPISIDLVLAGHTHGGQIRLPWIGSVPPIPDNLGREYDRGLFQFDNTQLFITSGVGEMGPRARLFTPPEIALLEIKI